MPSLRIYFSSCLWQKNLGHNFWTVTDKDIWHAYYIETLLNDTKVNTTCIVVKAMLRNGILSSEGWQLAALERITFDKVSLKSKKHQKMAIISRLIV